MRSWPFRSAVSTSLNGFPIPGVAAFERLRIGPVVAGHKGVIRARVDGSTQGEVRGTERGVAALITFNSARVQSPKRP